MTGNPLSSLAREADIHLDAGRRQEACPHNLAPTASTTAALRRWGCPGRRLLDARGFGPDDFARSHPGGTWSRRLLTHVRDVMRGDDPRSRQNTLITDAILAMSRAGSDWWSSTAGEPYLASSPMATCAAPSKNASICSRPTIASVMSNARTIGPDRLAVRPSK